MKPLQLYSVTHLHFFLSSLSELSALREDFVYCKL